MTPRELIPAEEYAKIKESEMKIAQERSDFYKNCTDKFNINKDQHPIMDIKHMLETSVERYGDAPAFHEKPSHKEPYHTYSYKDVKAEVDAIGTALHARDMRGKRIGVIGDNCYAWCIAYLAAVCGTGIVVPLDKELRPEEIEHIAIDAEIECVLYTKNFAETFGKIKENGKTKLSLLVNLNATDEKIAEFEVSRKSLVEQGEALLAEGNRDFLDAQIVNDQMGILLYTSGTTGVAKGVMLSHGNICADLMISPTVFTVHTWDVFFLLLPLHHTYACTCSFLVPMYKGASVAFCEGLRYITDNLKEIKPTMILGVPLLFENFYRKIWQSVRNQGKEKLLRRVISINRKTKKIKIDIGNIFFKKIKENFGGNLRQIICGGAAIDPDILDGFIDFGINALQGYGLTECAPICALNPEFSPKSSSAGYIIAGLDGKIKSPDEDGIGEICVKGPNVMLGYYKNKEATDAVLVDGWYHTGDHGYIDKDRFIFITGRKKNVIITKTGKNVFPEELEYLLGRSEYIAESMAWQGNTSQMDDTLIVVTILPDNEAITEKLGEDASDSDILKLLWEEVDAINKDLPYYKKIKKVLLRKEPFDMTSSKKIKRFIDENKEGVESESL